MMILNDPTEAKSTGRLWLPGMSPTDPVPAGPISLHDYFTQTFLPEVRQRGLSRDRIGELEQAVFRWKWWCLQKYRTAGPVLGEVTPSRLAEFRKDLIGSTMPGRDGKPRKVTPRSLNKTLQAIEQIVASAMDDGTLDESRGLLRVKKVPHPAQIDKVVIPDDALTQIIHAAADAKWPTHTVDGRAIDAGVMWQTAIALFVTYGMRTQDLIRYESDKMPIRWSCVWTEELSPAEDGLLTNRDGWLIWVPNKTRRTKVYPMCLPITSTAAHHIARWRESFAPLNEHDPLFPVPMNRDMIYDAWRGILASAGVSPKPRVMFDTDGQPVKLVRSYKIKYLRCTVGTRGDEHGASIGHPGVGRWITGHVSNDVFTRHYRAMEKPILETLTTLRMPDGFFPEPSPERPRLRIVG